MELNFLGCGSAFNPQFGNTSAYFEENGNLFLLDCGESTYERVVKLLNLDNYHNIYVILTHLHADHVGSLASLISYNYCILHKKICVVHPGRRVIKLLSLMGIDDSYYDYRKQFPAAEGMMITPISVSHVDNMESFGYLIDVKGHKIYYSGDSSDVPESILTGLKNGEISRIYQDTSTYDSPNPSHCFVGKLEEKISVELRKRVYCMHLDCDCRELLEEKGFCVVTVG